MAEEVGDTEEEMTEDDTPDGTEPSEEVTVRPRMLSNVHCRTQSLTKELERMQRYRPSLNDYGPIEASDDPEVCDVTLVCSCKSEEPVSRLRLSDI